MSTQNLTQNPAARNGQNPQEQISPFEVKQCHQTRFALANAGIYPDQDMRGVLSPDLIEKNQDELRKWASQLDATDVFVMATLARFLVLTPHPSNFFTSVKTLRQAKTKTWSRFNLNFESLYFIVLAFITGVILDSIFTGTISDRQALQVGIGIEIILGLYFIPKRERER
ncbi:MAG: hypothetical protein HS126_18785 [Anaerolineales bacterium]|nr:hypothetical protein [Anaerolineales bacterium]